VKTTLTITISSVNFFSQEFTPLLRASATQIVCEKAAIAFPVFKALMPRLFSVNSWI